MVPDGLEDGLKNLIAAARAQRDELERNTFQGPEARALQAVARAAATDNQSCAIPSEEARLTTPEQVLQNLRDAGEDRVTHEEVAQRLNGKLERRRVRLAGGKRVRGYVAELGEASRTAAVMLAHGIDWPPPVPPHAAL